MNNNLTEEQKLLVRREYAMRELAKRYYADYLRLTNRPSWIDTALSQYLADTVQTFIEAETGHAYDILILSTPPQHGKSMTLTEALPSWLLGKHPDWRVIIASYNEEYAERFCRRNKEKVRDYGKKLFGRGIGDINRAQEFELERSHGRLISRGIMSGITGNPAEFVLIDDPIKNRVEADSESTRSKLWEEWQNSIKTRLAAHAKVIVIMTRWHEDDLAARIIATETNVTVINLPVESQDDPPSNPDPMGRPFGAPLAPELGKDANWLAEFKSSYLNSPEGGARAWWALFMGQPRVEGGNLVQREWWKYYDPHEINQWGQTVISVDAAFKDSEASDYVAIEVLSKRDNDYYIRYVNNARRDFPSTLAAIRLIKSMYPESSYVLIEDKANGSAIISTLQKEMFCIPVNPEGGKVSRVNAVAPAIESGHVYLPQGAPWLDDFIDQFCAFPAGAHDDMVDACTQGLHRLLFSSGRFGVRELTLEEKQQQLAENAFTSSALFEPYGDTDDPIAWWNIY